MINIKRNIKPFTFCLLSTALSSICLYGIKMAMFSENSSHLNITKYTFLNNIISTINTFNNNLRLGYLIGIGLLALIFELAFSDSMYEFFSRIPLGSIKKYDYFDRSRHGFKYLVKHSIAVLAPALIIGFYVVIHLVFYSEYPDNLDICIERILPVAILLTLIISLALTISVIKYGGLWGVLVRLPLLFTSNICLCTVIGFLAISFGIFIVSILGFIIFIVFILPLTINIMIRNL